jgi:hypothetical protein
MFDLCTQMADAAKMPKNNTAPLLACFLAGCLLQQKGVRWVLIRVLRPPSERASGIVTKTSTNNNSNKGGHKYKQGTEKNKEKKGAFVPRPSFSIFLHLFIGPSPPSPPKTKPFLFPKS